MRTTIIAEAGLNHKGDPGDAMRLADAAKRAGADVVKFQTFEPDTVAPALQRFALPKGATIALSRHCWEIGIEFCSTPDDVDSLRFLVEHCGVRRIKIGSGSLLFRPLMDAAFYSGRQLLISTGMANMAEIREALPPGCNITLMHCVSLYPCPVHLANVLRIDTLWRTFRRPVGYSDHTLGGMASVMAIARGALVVEKHLALNGDPTQPDWAVSLVPEGFAEYVTMIRDAEKMMGDGMIFPSAEERAMIPLLRKDENGRQPGVPA